MKKLFKVIGIALGSLICLVLLVVFVACYLVFTPKRLTPIVNQVADSVVTCPHSLESVNLTFFRTFPNFGVEVKGLYIINPTEGAQSDTVLAVPDLVVGVDLMKAIDGDIVIRKFALNDVAANLFIGADGQTNFDVISLPEDTTEQDTTPSSWQLRSVVFDEALKIRATGISFVDKKDSMEAALQNIRLAVAPLDGGARLDLNADKVDLLLGETKYADGLQLAATLPVVITDTARRQLRIDGTRLAINQFEVALDGSAEMIESWTAAQVDCDLTLKTNDWRISELLALLPAEYQDIVPKEVNADGDLQLMAHAVGRYDSVTMPIVDAELLLKDAAGNYDLKVLPYKFNEIAADICAHVDLNKKSNTTAELKKLFARTGKTSVALSGSVKDILKDAESIELANPLCQMVADLNISLPDADYWIKSDSTTSALKGVLKGKVRVNSRLNDLTDVTLNKIKLNGDLAISDLDVLWQDSIKAQADKMTIVFSAPRQKVKNPKLLSADCQITMDKLHADVMNANLVADIANGSLAAAVELDPKDTTRIPTIEADFSMATLVADMDTIHADGKNVKGHASMAASRRNESIPRFTVKFASDALNAAMGQGLKARTGKIKIEANARYKKDEENVLLKWSPRLKFDLNQGHVDMATLGTPVEIPQILFSYSNRDFQIDTSRIVIGKSDFSLAGEIKNLGKWLRKEGELVGSLRFTSDHTDVNELLAIVNKMNTDSEEPEAQAQQPKAETAQTAQTESEPFMVPERVDLSLITRIKSADAFDQNLKNLGGQVIIKDGQVIIEEMGFICEAAKLQLTAMYKTPRRDHIYVGFDYHMIDIDLQQLIAMIPQLDTLVPMLRDFRGGAQFHIAAETYVNSKYEVKYSTLRGACSIEGNDLVLLDSKTFSTISKILMFNKKTENKIDSISVQIALYKDQITVYPFCISIDNYMAAVGGNHYTDMTFNYHASLLKPLYIGVDVKGNLDDLQIKPAKCRYAKDFRPLFHRDAEDRSEELRNIISTSLKKNVKIQ